MPPVVHGDRDASFLDAPGIGAEELLAIVEGLLDEMAPDAVLTLFNDQPGVPEAAASWCTAHRVELVAVIAHEAGGATLALRRIGVA